MTAKELAEVLLLYEDHEVKIDTPLGQFSVGDIEEDEDLDGDIVRIEATKYTDDIK